MFSFSYNSEPVADVGMSKFVSIRGGDSYTFGRATVYDNVPHQLDFSPTSLTSKTFFSVINLCIRVEGH